MNTSTTKTFSLSDFTNFVYPQSLSPDDLYKAQRVETAFWTFINNLPLDKDYRSNGVQTMLWCSPNISQVIKACLAKAVNYSPPSVPQTSFWTRMRTKFWYTRLFDMQPNSLGLRLCAYFPLSAQLLDVQRLDTSPDYLYLTAARVINTASASSVQLPDVNSISVVAAIRAQVLALGSSTQLMLSIGGWNNGDDSAFVALSEDMDRMEFFAGTCVTTCVQMGFAGIDIDWQYPDTSIKLARYQTLIHVLSIQLHAHNLLLSTTVTGPDNYKTATPFHTQPEATDDFNTVEAYPLQQPSVMGSIDFLNVQAYDMGNGRQTITDAITSIQYWASVLPDLHKLNLGIPCYANDSTSYRSIVDTYGNLAAVSDTLGGKYYNGTAKVRLKTQSAISNKFGGIVFVNYLQDVQAAESSSNSLMNTAKLLLASEIVPSTSYFDQLGLTGALQLITGDCNWPTSLSNTCVFLQVPLTQAYTTGIRPVVDQALAGLVL